jgi:hypothetical protein
MMNVLLRALHRGSDVVNYRRSGPEFDLSLLHEPFVKRAPTPFFIELPSRYHIEVVPQLLIDAQTMHQ